MGGVGLWLVSAGCLFAHQDDVKDFNARLMPSLTLLLVAVSAVAWAMIRQSETRVLVACAVPMVIPVFILEMGVAFVRSEFTAWREGVSAPVPWFTRWPVEYPEAALTALVWL
jgi:hypothetical protein